MTTEARQEFDQLLENLRNRRQRHENDDDDDGDDDGRVIVFANHPDRDNDACARLLGDVLLQRSNNAGQRPAPPIDCMSIQLHQLTEEGDCDSLLEWVANSDDSPQEITLDGHGDYTIMPGSSPRVVARFLGAIQASRRIRKVELVGCPQVDATIFASFIETTSATDLEVDCAVFESEEDEHGGRERVAAAFRRNTSLQRLYLEITEETQSFVVAIIRQLAFNRILQHLALEWSPPEQRSVNVNTTRALEALLHSRSSRLQYLELMYFEFLDSNHALEPLVRGLEHSRIEELSLQLCRLDNSATRLLERALLADTHRVRTLALPQSQLGTNNEATLPMLTNLLLKGASPSSLTALQLDSPRIPDKGVTEFVEALKNCRSLRRLSLEYLKNAALYRKIVQALPSLLYLESLHMSLGGTLVQLEDVHHQRALIDALRGNGSLMDIEIRPFSVPSTFTLRNQGVQRWFLTHHRATTAEKRAKTCPRVFPKVADTQHGATWIFRSLIELEDAVGSCKPE